MGLSKHGWIPHFRPWHFGVNTIIFTTFLVHFGVPAGFFFLDFHGQHIWNLLLWGLYMVTPCRTPFPGPKSTHISVLDSACQRPKPALPLVQAQILSRRCDRCYFSNAVNILVTKIGWYLWMLIPVKYGSTGFDTSQEFTWVFGRPPLDRWIVFGRLDGQIGVTTSWNFANKGYVGFSMEMGLVWCNLAMWHAHFFI